MMKRILLGIAFLLFAALVAVLWGYYEFQRERRVVLLDEQKLCVNNNPAAIHFLEKEHRNPSDPICIDWYLVTNLSAGRELQAKLKIPLPENDYSKYWVIISYGHPVKKLSYHMFDRVLSPDYVGSFWEFCMVEIRLWFYGDWPDNRNIRFKRDFYPQTYIVYKTPKLDESVRRRLEYTNQLDYDDDLYSNTK